MQQRNLVTTLLAFIDLFPKTAALFIYIFLEKDCLISRGHISWGTQRILGVFSYVSVQRVVVLVFFTLWIHKNLGKAYKQSFHRFIWKKENIPSEQIHQDLFKWIWIGRPVKAAPNLTLFLKGYDDDGKVGL